MIELIAKPIIKNQFWIVTDGNKKVGNIEANNAGYGVQINGTFFQCNDTEEIKRLANIKFESVKKVTASTKPYSEYPTPNKVHNSVFDVVRGLHLFTKSAKSKCLHVAGWFVFDQGDTKQIVFCPKYIFVQRYTYFGPFKSETEAEIALNS